MRSYVKARRDVIGDEARDPTEQIQAGSGGGGCENGGVQDTSRKRAGCLFDREQELQMGFSVELADGEHACKLLSIVVWQKGGKDVLYAEFVNSETADEPLETLGSTFREKQR